MKKSSVSLAIAFACTGCASVMNDATHPMKVETKMAGGELVSGADCKLTNDYGSINVKSGDTAPVRRLGALSCCYMGFVAELPARLGKGADLIIEPPERGLDLGVDDRPDGAQSRASLLVEPHEGHPLVQLRVRTHAVTPNSTFV